MSILKLGIVGPGIQWQGHRDILLTLSDRALITAVCARTHEKAQAQAALCGSEVQTFTDYQDMLDQADIDAVVVCTPIALNGDMTLTAIQTGKHVFVEKPFAMTSEQASAIIQAQQASDVQVYVLENLLYTDAWDKLRALWTDGSLGELAMFDRAMHGRIAIGGDPYGFGDTSWRVNGDFPLGPLFDGGIHEIALQSKLFGSAKAVMANGQNFREEHGAYDNICALIEYDDGVIGQITHSGLMAGHENYFNIRCMDGLIACDYTTATVKPFDGDAEFKPLTDSIETFWPDLAKAMWFELMDCCQSNTPGRYGLKQAAGDIATLEAIERSLDSGQREAVTIRS